MHQKCYFVTGTQFVPSSVGKKKGSQAQIQAMNTSETIEYIRSWPKGLIMYSPPKEGMGFVSSGGGGSMEGSNINHLNTRFLGNSNKALTKPDFSWC